MILPKYYCKKCKQFKHRWEVKKRDKGFYYILECKWCHKQVTDSKNALEEVMKDYYEWKEERFRKFEIKLFTEHSR